MNKTSKKILAILAATFAVLAFATISTVAQEGLAHRLSGYMLLSADQNGQLWYVLPESDQRVYLGNAEMAWDVIRDNMLGINDADLDALRQSTEAAERVSGKFLLATESGGAVYFVRPADNRLYHIGTGEIAFQNLARLSVGISWENLKQIPISALSQDLVAPVVEPTPAPAPDPTPVVESVEYTDAELGWAFASGLWNGYEDFNNNRGHYPDIKWLVPLFEYDLTIYFSEDGFQLASGDTNYFVWDNVGPEFLEFFDNYFSFKTDGTRALMTFSLPADVETEEYGLLKAGVYHFSSDKQFMLNEEFKNSPWFYETNPELDTPRIIDHVREIQLGVARYHADTRGWYPLTPEGAIELGEFGAVKLSYGRGFHGTDENHQAYVQVVQSGFPTTHLMWDAPAYGQPYTLTFEIYGEYDGFTPGRYVARPGGIDRIGDL